MNDERIKLYVWCKRHVVAKNSKHTFTFRLSCELFICCRLWMFFFYRTIRSFCHPILCVLLVPLVLVLRHLKYSAHSMLNINQFSVVSLTNCQRNNKNDETSKTSFGEFFFFFNPRGFVPITPLFSFMACWFLFKM